MGPDRTPRHQKKAIEKEATLIFLDEACFQMFPLRKRTLAPRGRTPLLHAWDRRGKFSVIGAITLSRRTQRPNFLFQLLPQGENFNGERVVEFLRCIRRRIPGPLFLIWDRACIHRGNPVRKFLARAKGIETFHFPAYAPDTNPVEGCWGHAKYHQLPNLLVSGPDALAEAAEASLNEIASRRGLLSSFVRHAEEPRLT